MNFTPDATQPYHDLAWILQSSNEGFFAAVTTPRMQNKIAELYEASPSVGVLRFEPNEDYTFGKIYDFVEAHPDKAAYFILHLDFAVETEQGIFRLNMCRDQMAQLHENLVFFFSKETDQTLCCRAMDFYSYFKFFLPFEDDLPKQEEYEALPIPDQSIGISVAIDSRLPKSGQLLQARRLTRQAKQLTEEYRYRDAITLLNEVLRVRQEQLGESHPDAVESLSDLADVYHTMRDYSKAKELLLQALQHRKDTLGEQNVRTANLYNGLGVVSHKLGESSKALKYLSKALTIYQELAEQSPAAFRPDLAGICNNLGLFYADNGKPTEAENLYKKALDIYKKLAEQNPAAFLPNLATTCNNLGNFYADNGKPTEAENLYKKTLTIYQELAEQNPDAFRPYLATICNNLGNFYKNNGKPTETEELLQKALTIYQELAEQNPAAYLPDLADTEFNLSLFYCQSKGDIPHALSLAQQAHDHYASMAESSYRCLQGQTKAKQLLQVLEGLAPAKTKV